jgi:hypothetical protein
MDGERIPNPSNLNSFKKRKNPMRKRGSVFVFILIGILAGLHFAGLQASAQNPRGQMKGAIHHNLSADWLHPSVSSFSTPCYVPLYFFHDALLKPNCFLINPITSVIYMAYYTISRFIKEFEKVKIGGDLGKFLTRETGFNHFGPLHPHIHGGNMVPKFSNHL